MNPNSHCARPVHQIISMIKWIRTSRLSLKNSLSQNLLASRVPFLHHVSGTEFPAERHLSSANEQPPPLRGAPEHQMLISATLLVFTTDTCTSQAPNSPLRGTCLRRTNSHPPCERERGERGACVCERETEERERSVCVRERERGRVRVSEEERRVPR